MSLITKFLGPTWDPPGADRTQVGPMWATWTLLSGVFIVYIFCIWYIFMLIKNLDLNLKSYWVLKLQNWMSVYIVLKFVRWLSSNADETSAKCVKGEADCKHPFHGIVSSHDFMISLIARFLGPTWGPSGADRTQVGPMLAPWTLLSGMASYHIVKLHPGHQLKTESGNQKMS